MMVIRSFVMFTCELPSSFSGSSILARPSQRISGQDKGMTGGSTCTEARCTAIKTSIVWCCVVSLI